MESVELEYRDEDGRTLIGLALPFDDVALAAPGRPEIAARGAIASPTEVELRDGHDGPRIGTATVYETAQGYEMRAELDAGDSDRYRGGRLSVGFQAIKDRVSNGVRILESIVLDHVAVVTNPAYAGAQITETREGTPMDETTEETATAVADPTPTPQPELVELREQLADVTRELKTAPWRTNEDPPEHRVPTEIRTLGEYVYHKTVAMSPGEVTPTQHALSLEKLGTTEVEFRQQTTASGDSPIPAPLIGPVVELVRSGSPFTRALGSRPLPGEGGMTITRPTVTQGTAGAWETAEGDAAGSQQFTTGEISGAIKAYKIANNLTMQSVLRSNPSAVDALVRDQAAEIAQALEASVINGGGTLAVTTGELAGILQDGSIQDVTLATWDAAAFMAAWSTAYSNCVTATNAPPRFVGMHPRRWAKILGLVDADTRPLFDIAAGTPVNVPGAGTFGMGSDAGGAVAIGSIQGVPVVASSGIPSTLGTGTNEDILILVAGGSAEPFELYESGVMSAPQWMNPSTFQTTYARAFMAALLPVRPAGVCTISGAGLVP